MPPNALRDFVPYDALRDVRAVRWLSASARTIHPGGPFGTQVACRRSPCTQCRRLLAGLEPCRTIASAVLTSPSVATAAHASANAAPSGDALVAAVRQATAKYHDVTHAIADGYADPATLAAACLEVPGVGTMGIHAANMRLLMDQAVDPLKPEVLLYVPKKGGGFRLVGIEYLVPLMPGQDALPTAPSVFGQTFEGPMDGHEPGMPRHYDKHVWIWSPNPDGMFAQFNSRLTCSAVPEE